MHRRFRTTARPPRSGRATGVLLITAIALVTVGCGKSHPKAAHPSASATPTPSPSSTAPASANFSTQGVRAVDSQDRPSSNATANDAAKKVIALINTYYNTAFLQPASWGNGAFPTLSSLFTGDAAGSVPANLQAMSLGPLAPQVSRVNPSKESAGVVAVLIEDNGSATFATVTTRFEATGEPAGTAAPVGILQSAQFMVNVPAGKIAGYDVSTSFSGLTKTASYHAPGGTS